MELRETASRSEVPAIDAQEGAPGGLIETLEELDARLAREPLGGWSLMESGRGFVAMASGGAVALLLDRSIWSDPERLRTARERAGGRAFLLLAGQDREFERTEHVRDLLAGSDDVALVTLPLGTTRLAHELRRAERAAAGSAPRPRDRAHAERSSYELSEIMEIARALSSERDIDRLLGLILEKSRYITGADAGSVYVVESRRLHFKVTQNDSLAVDLKEFTIPVDERSIVGQAVLRRQSIRIPDMYALEDPAQNPWGFRHDRSIDERTGYQTRSTLTVPMIDAGGDVIGVVQLINKKREPAAALRAPEDFAERVVPFDERSQDLAETLASQAGISLENALLYDDIRRLFEGFVHASVTAIESRDPTTSGHSQRVAQLTVGLAEQVDRARTGRFAEVHFTRDALKEIEYAALLHDFGKVGVRESVLVKSKKLYEPDRDRVLARFELLKERARANAAQRKLAAVAETLDAGRPAGGEDAADRLRARLREIEEELDGELRALDRDVAVLLAANEPTVLEEGSFGHLREIARRTFVDSQGREQPMLLPAELEALSLARGSLTRQERQEIESHVVHTYNFLRRIPWGRTFRHLPEIAAAHHEKLDGSGYPRGLKAPDIPMPARMMTIADIFDALTASDRPYKRAVPFDRALDILAADTHHGKLDADLFQLFVDAKVYQLVL